jgi:hypothetical protein
MILAPFACLSDICRALPMSVGYMVLVYKNWRVMVIRCKDIVAKGQFVLRLN